MCGDYSSTLVNEDSHLEADYEDRSIGFGTFEDEDGDPFDSDDYDEEDLSDDEDPNDRMLTN